LSPIVVGGLADLALRRLASDRVRHLEIEADQGRHGAGAHRHRLLHGIATQAQQSRRIGERQAPGGGQSRIFAERMAGDESDVAGKVEPGFVREHPHCREAHRHQRRLGIGRQRQNVGWALPHDRRQLLAERLIDLGEYVPSRGESIGECLAHAHNLAALAGKYERDSHLRCPLPRKACAAVASPGLACQARPHLRDAPARCTGLASIP
jgi:hypothetical protein